MAFFDPTRPAYLANPYPALARLRKEEPVHWSAGLRAWVCTRYEECSLALHDGSRFTTDPTLTESPRAEAILAHRKSVPLGKVATLGTTSGEAHRRLRQVVNPVFAPAAVKSLETGIAADVEALLDAAPAGQPVEFMAAFANVLPRRVMLRVMGFPPDHAEELQHAFAAIEVTRSNPSAGSPADAMHAQEALAGQLESLLSAGAAEATVLGALGHARGSDANLSPDEVLSVAAHIATVGADPTSGALGNALLALATHPDAAEDLRADPSLTRSAVHEFLRFDSPTHIAPRFAVVETELGGRRVRRGDAVLAVVGAANRDPAVFEKPDRLDIHRDARKQLSFGQGEHICLGMGLALSMLETGLNAILRRWPTMEVASEPVYSGSIELRVPDSLILRFA